MGRYFLDIECCKNRPELGEVFYFILTVVKSSGRFMLVIIHSVSHRWVVGCIVFFVVTSLQVLLAVPFCLRLIFCIPFLPVLFKFLHNYNIVASLGCAICMHVCVLGSVLLQGIFTQVYLSYIHCVNSTLYSFPNFPGWMGHMGGNVIKYCITC